MPVPHTTSSSRSAEIRTREGKFGFIYVVFTHWCTDLSGSPRFGATYVILRGAKRSRWIQECTLDSGPEFCDDAQNDECLGAARALACGGRMQQEFGEVAAVPIRELRGLGAAGEAVREIHRVRGLA